VRRRSGKQMPEGGEAGKPMDIKLRRNLAEHKSIRDITQSDLLE